MTFPRIATLLAMGLALAAPLPLRAEDSLTLVLDWYVNPDHGPIIIAQEKGFFADQGLKVEVIAPADPGGSRFPGQGLRPRGCRSSRGRA